MIARAKNGTGKTAAFLIPLIDSINISINAVQGLILVPTRELALQISSIIIELSKYKEL